MGNTWRQSIVDRSQAEMNLSSPNQPHQPSQITVAHTSGDLRIDRPNPLAESGHDLWPVAGVRATHHDQPIEVDPGLSRGERRRPTSHIDHHHRSLLRVLGEHPITDPGEAGACRAGQLDRPAGLKGEDVDRTLSDPGGQVPSIHSELGGRPTRMFGARVFGARVFRLACRKACRKACWGDSWGGELHADLDSYGTRECIEHMFDVKGRFDSD